MPRFMLDTNVFNSVLDGRVPLEWLRGKDLVATHVQKDEIEKTKCATRREELLRVFREVLSESNESADAQASHRVVPTESAVFDVSRWDEAKWGGSDDGFAKLRAELDGLNNSKRNNSHDTLIAWTAARNGWVLVTEDRDLFFALTKHGGACANAYVFNLV